jgi:hypothetical protein
VRGEPTGADKRLRLLWGGAVGAREDRRLRSVDGMTHRVVCSLTARE